jgi:hypothetical protein
MVKPVLILELKDTVQGQSSITSVEGRSAVDIVALHNLAFLQVKAKFIDTINELAAVALFTVNYSTANPLTRRIVPGG